MTEFFYICNYEIIHTCGLIIVLIITHVVIII